MKKLLIFSFSIVTSLTWAQDNVGIGILTPNPKAILDLTAVDKGFLAPRMTSTQRINISPTNSEEGLLVFDTDLKFYFYWDGTQWVQFPGSDADSDPTNELITNVVFNTNGNILTIEEGGNTWSTTISVNDPDSDPTNELQNLSLNGNTLSISNGNSVDLSSYANTDNQTLSLSGTQLSISNGNTVDLSTLAAGNDWSLIGNAGTNVTTNYIGTSDSVGLSIRTNATERIRITAQTGFVGIGQTPSYPLDVLGQTRLIRQNGNIATANESQLELFNNGSGDVYISFHKAGVWGSHFGLDATNWFSTTGWSAGAGYTNMRVGSFQANGSAQVTDLGGSGNVPVYADNNGTLYKGTGVNAPVQIFSFTVPSAASNNNGYTFDTGIDANTYDCVLCGDYSTAYDIDENSRRQRKMWLYLDGGTNRWFYNIRMGVHSDNPQITNNDIKVMCFIKSMTNWNGNGRTLNNNY